MIDVGDPYDDDVVDQVFAVITQPNSRFAAGSWTHSRNTKNGKVDNSVERYSVDPTTQEDRIGRLTGQAALSWESQIYNPTNILIQPSNGQDSNACRNVLRKPASNRGTSQ